MPPNKLWKFLKSLGIGKDRPHAATDINLNALNRHFSTSPVSLDPLIKHNTLAVLSNKSPTAATSLKLGEISAEQVVKILNTIKTKAVGNDGISLEMISPFKNIIAPYLAHIINFSLANGSFPKAWKLAHVLPLPKKSNPSTFSEYRPISILPVLSKVIEHYVHQQLSDHLHHHALLNQFQSGFRVGHSTVSALVNITDDFRHSIENKELTILALLDFSSAFNSVDFDILLNVLNLLNLSPVTLDWFRSYLFDRHQLTKIDERVSDWCSLDAGVPQGGILSPILFSVFINGITSSLTSSLHLYADDLQIYSAAPFSKISQAIDTVNLDLASIAKWAKEFGLLVNASKSQAIVIGSPYFTSRLDISSLPVLSFDGTPIPYSNSVKNLGIFLDQTLSWSVHFNEVSRRLYGSLHSLKRLQNFLPLETKAMLSRSLLLPLLDYGNVVFLDANEDLFDKLERLQNQCIRFVYGLRKYDHVSEFRTKLNWLPVRLRRDLNVLTLLYKVLLSSNSPSYLRDRFQFRTAAGDRLRSGTNLSLVIPIHSTQTFTDSFTVHAARLWNHLPTHIRFCPSVTSFKTCLLKHWGYNLVS